MESFGTRLSLLRKSRNLSQEEFAEIMDVSRQSISKWENDTAYPEMTKPIFMSRYFSVSLDYLVMGNADADSSSKENMPKTNTLIQSISSFFSNLNGRQLVLFYLLCALLILICLAILYGIGYAMGKAVLYLTR